MATYWGSIGAGVTSALDDIQRRKGEEQRQRAQQFLLDQEQASANADAAGADALTSYLAKIAQPAPPPGQSSQPSPVNPQIPGMAGRPQSLMPPMPPQGVPQQQARPGQPGVMPGAPGGPSGPSMPPPRSVAPYGPQGGQGPIPIPPYRDPMQSRGGPLGMVPTLGEIPPPPKPQVPDPSKLPPPVQMAADLKKQGAKPQAILAALKSYMPMYEAAQRDQIKDMEVQLRAQEAGQRAAMQVLLETGRNSRFGQKEADLAPSRAARISVDKEKADAAMLRAQKYKTGSGQTIPPAGDVDRMANAVADGRLDPRMLSIKGGYREKVIERALEINPEYDSKNYAADNAFQTSEMRAAGNAGASTAIAARAAQGGADILEQAAAQVPRGDWRRINSALAAARGEAGIPEQGAFDAALNTFVNEYARAVNPKGTATVSDKVHARDLLSTADSPETFAAKMRVLRAEMQRGRQAPQDVAADMRASRGGKSAGKPKTLDWSDLK